MLTHLLAASIALAADAGSSGPPGVEFEHGPLRAKIEDHAEIEVPKGFVFTGKKGTIKLMEMMGNLTNDHEVGFLAPATVFDQGSKDSWFVVFEFNDVGYVKDDEKKDIDPAKILEGMKEGVVKGNEVRKSKGLPTMEVVGWAVEPHYEEKTNNLEWGLHLRVTSERKRGEKVETEVSEVINYDVRLLGRHGVMQSTLVLAPEQLKATLPRFRNVLASYEFASGAKYAEYKAGDKIAKIGLLGLIGAGGLAVAAKTGLLKYIGKFFLPILLAIGAFFKAIAAFFKKLWNRTFGKTETLD